MYKLYPYFTNDLSVGLFSPADDDIYHSTYGALSESWQKFVLPAHLKEYIENHNSVKILDICYGIGYNTKTSLNVFLDDILFKNKNTNKNIFTKIFSKKNNLYKSNIAQIYTDNIFNKTFIQNFIKITKNEKEINTPIEEIDSNNIKDRNNSNLAVKSINNMGKNNINSLKSLTEEKGFHIDAIDIDSVLFGISPFTTNRKKLYDYFKINTKCVNEITDNEKFAQIAKMKNIKLTPLKKEHKIKKEVQIILLHELLRKNPEIISNDVCEILSEKKYAQFFDADMINLLKFYQSQGYIYNKKLNKSTFLHNIYYRYISRSYKTALKCLNSCKITINFNQSDARTFLKNQKDSYNFIYLDAFTPAKCPALWTLDFFKKLYELLSEDGMILTYSNSAAIRNAFLESGFYVGKIYDDKTKKFTGTIALKDKKLLECPLSEYDIGLCKTKAGICYRDQNLDLDNNKIIENRNKEVESSTLLSSSKYVKGHKNG